MIKFKLLGEDDIECRVKKLTDKGAVILLYKTARTDMDFLDEAVGVENWECDYREIKENLYCGIGIRAESGMVWKWDCGIESREDSDGNQKKGEASDSFKRAGFKWGIGRELYTAPFIFVRADQINIKDGKTNDTFSVIGITYDEKRRISALSIINDKTRKICFSWESGQIPQTEAMPLKPKSPPEVKAPAPSVLITCADCGQVLKPGRRGSEVIPVKAIADGTLKEYGRVLCTICATEVSRANNTSAV